MIPGFCLTRLNQRYQEEPSMTCKTPCKNCTCDTVYSSDYIEADPSPMATQQRQWLESPSTYFMRECAIRPNSAHCRCD